MPPRNTSHTPAAREASPSQGGLEEIPERMREARVLLAGLGNIGSFLAVLLAPIVGSLRLVDRDLVEPRNLQTNCTAPPAPVGPKPPLWRNTSASSRPH